MVVKVRNGKGGNARTVPVSSQHAKETLSDTEALVSLMEQGGSPTTVLDMQQRLETLLSLNHYHTLVAVDKEQVVGMIGMCLVWHYEARVPYGQILAFVVAQAYRSSRIGTHLVTEAEHWFQDRGAERIVVSQRKTRSATHHFYERLGYRRTEGHVVKTMEQGAKEIPTG
jgi:ribosomal protein S18 acetylase RimI-like enzyme